MEHSYNNLIPLGGNASTSESITCNANFSHQVAYVSICSSEITIEDSKLGIELEISSPHIKHVNHYTNRNRHDPGMAHSVIGGKMRVKVGDADTLPVRPSSEDLKYG